MPARSRQPMRIAFRVLLTATGLMLGLLVAVQCFPELRKTFGLVTIGQAQQDVPPPPKDDPDEPAVRLDDLPDPFEPTPLSGSATGKTTKKRMKLTTKSRQPTTLEMEESDVFDPGLPSPVPAENEDAVDSKPELKRLQERLKELEQRGVLLSEQQKLSLEQSQEQVEKLQEKVQEQALDLKEALTRLQMAERQVNGLQETLRSVKPLDETDEEADAHLQRISLKFEEEDGNQRLLIEARDASLPELFARLGEVLGRNLLVSPSVAGTISLHMKIADGEEALEAICQNHHCQLERSGNFLLITQQKPADETAKEDQPPETITKLYRLKHLSGAEIRPFVQAVLTPVIGTISFTSIRERIGRTAYRDPPRAILVRDTPKVIAEVDRLVLELDLPPARGQELPPSTGDLFQMPAETSPFQAWPHMMPQRGPLPTGPGQSEACQDCDSFEPPVISPSIAPRYPNR